MAITIIVEDGSVVESANSYVSVADADTYHTNLGQSAWTGTDDEKSSAILRAMRYLENLNWTGWKTSHDNPLAWPRYQTFDRDGKLYDSDIVPQNVVNALCEAALVELVSAGALRPTTSTTGQVKRQKVDVIETEYFESYNSSQSFDAIDYELTGLVSGGGNMVSLTRV